MAKKKLEKITYVTHRLEIAFWQATMPVSVKPRHNGIPAHTGQPARTGLLRRASLLARTGLRTLAGKLGCEGYLQRKVLSAPDRSLVLAAAGSLFLLMVVWFSFRFVGSNSPVLLQRSADAAYQKTLVVTVDELPGQAPLLRGIWLVTMPSEQPLWMVVPVYPASLKGGEELDVILAQAFKLGPRGSLGTKFRHLLHEREINWDSVVVLDEFALAGYIDLLGGVEIGLGRLDGAQAVAQVLSSQISSQKSLVAQAVLIRSLCRQSIALFRDVDPLAARERFSGHLYTDHPARLWAEKWYHMRDYGHGLVCEFPTLQSQLSNYRP